MAVLFVHHAGKGGAQRGTSRREDVLDTVILLKRPADYDPRDGARFEIHIDKGRTIFGNGAAALEARLEINDRGMLWTMRRLDDALVVRAADLFREGYKVRDAARELGVSKSKADRLKKKALEQGLLGDITEAVPLSHSKECGTPGTSGSLT